MGLDELKEKKREEREQQMQQGAEQQEADRLREQIKQIAKQYLTSDARDRLNNIRHVKPQLATQIEMQLVQLHRAGQLNEKIDDDTLKDLLRKLQNKDTDDREIKFRR